MSSLPSDNVAALLKEAVAFHQQGKLGQAQALYSRVLAISPAQFDAVHMLGVIARQEGQAELAVTLISDAIALNPANASAHCNLGAAFQAAGRSAEALASYDRAVALDPGYALAFCNRGNALRQLGRLDEALLSYRRALDLRPAYPEAWCNSAIALHDLGRSDEAAAAAERALQCRPAYPDALRALGNALQGSGRFADALDCYQRALALKGEDAELYCCSGTAFQRLRRFDQALDSYERAIALKPKYWQAHQFRANTCAVLGRRDEAAASYQAALALGGTPEPIRFALAALGDGSAPSAAPADYVKSLFDQYAGHFDEHLLGVLGYRTPAILAEALARRGFADAGPTFDVLDLGCGTGLCAPCLRPWSRTLTGVDLSEKMLEKARERGLYDRLECAGIDAFLAGKTSSYDLVVAADVFVYIGDLSATFAQVHAALRDGGTFCFSVEACDDAPFTLMPSQRYAHSLAYLQALAAGAGFAFVEAAGMPVRTDHGEQLMGYAVILEKSPQPGTNA